MLYRIWACGKPCHDSTFNCADLLVLVNVRNIDASYARHFLDRIMEGWTMVGLRVTRRVLLLTLHVLLGLLLTPLILKRRGDGELRTNPAVTSWWHNRVADILGVQITVVGHRPQAPALLASNHVSWLDIVVLGGLTHTDFLSKHEVRRWPLIGWLAARSGTLFIRRGTGEAATVSAQIAGRLRSDGLLTLFPEGTTTDGRDVRPFFSRLFAAALDTGTDVVPVGLRYHVDGEHDPVAPYTDQQSLADNLRGLLVRERTQVHVAFSEPITLRDHTRKQVAELARAAVRDALRSPPGTLLTHGAQFPVAG